MDGFPAISKTFSYNYRLFALRGILAIVFAVMSFLWPAAAFAGFVIFFGAYAFATGLLTLLTGWRTPQAGARRKRIGIVILEGLLGVAVGALTFWRPALTGLSLVLLFAGWAIVSGALQIAAAIRLRKEIQGEWFLVLSGLVSITLGALIFANPIAGPLAIAWWMGAWAMITGVTLVSLSIRLRNWARAISQADQETKAGGEIPQRQKISV